MHKSRTEGRRALLKQWAENTVRLRRKQAVDNSLERALSGHMSARVIIKLKSYTRTVREYMTGG